MDKYEPTDIRQQTKTRLFEIWVAVVEHKKLFIAVWILISLIGMMAAVMMPAKYSYITIIGFGTNYEGLVVAEAAVARAKLNAVIIPVAQRKYIEDGGVYDINVEVLVKSPSMLSLESSGTIESAQDNYNIHKTIFEALRNEHNTILTKQSEAGIMAREEHTLKLKVLEEEVVLLNKNLKRLDEMDASLKRQAIKSDADAALLHIILINQIEFHRAELKKDLAGNIAGINWNRLNLASIQKNLDRLRETFLAVPTTQSKNAVAPNRMLIVIGGILSGLVIGILSVLLLDFFTKLRRKEK